ncbi:MAG: hypothetical protein KatS3mg019_0358 [Fimbriimonadales bacterium]|nr:MAG: hypothetical protein KatS3mg019_0358 [Fimbriimonadales bacterium]
MLSSEQGEFTPLLEWLREKVHQQGQRYSAKALIQRITGNPPSAEPLVAYFQRKFAPLYGL